MNGEGVSLVGPGLPFGYVGGVPPGKIPFGGPTGNLETEPSYVFDYDEPGNRLIISNLTGNAGIINFSPANHYRQNVTSTAVTPYNGNAYMILLVTTGAGAFTVNLISAVGQLGRTHCIKKVDAGVGQVTIDAAGAETIDGALTYVLAAQWNSVTIVSDGVNWQVIATT